MNLPALPLTLGIACAAAAPTFASANPPDLPGTMHKVALQQVRNATVKISYGDTTFLIDPMLSRKDTYPGFQHTSNDSARATGVSATAPFTKVLW